MTTCANCGKELGSEEATYHYSCPKLPLRQRKFRASPKAFIEITVICNECVDKYPDNFILIEK